MWGWQLKTTISMRFNSLKMEFEEELKEEAELNPYVIG